MGKPYASGRLPRKPHLVDRLSVEVPVRYLVEGDPFLIERGLTVEPPLDILCPFPLRKSEGDALPEGRVVSEPPRSRIPVQTLREPKNVVPRRHFLLRPIRLGEDVEIALTGEVATGASLRSG